MLPSFSFFHHISKHLIGHNILVKRSTSSLSLICNKFKSFPLKHVCENFANNGKLFLNSDLKQFSVSPLFLPRSFSILSDKMKHRLQKLGVVLPDKYSNEELEKAAKDLLNSTFVKIPLETFQKYTGLDDTFYMWLKIVHVHLWMLACQMPKGGRDGELVLNYMLRMLNDDMEVRLKSFENEVKQNLEIKKKLEMFAQDLTVSFLFLDEGNVKGDAMLASALWTLFYSESSKQADIWHLETFVHYIRLVLSRLEPLSFDFFIRHPKDLDWSFPQEIIQFAQEEDKKWAQ